MAKAVILGVCIMAFASMVVHSHHNNEVFKVEGDVYCDPCRVQFQTPLSTMLPGAEIKVECMKIETRALTFSANGTTDGRGHYVMDVEGDHEDDTCEVKVVSSPDMRCSVPLSDMAVSRIECTNNSGIHTDVRYANPIGFMTNEVSPKCVSVLEELFVDED